jgi:hypothetical protein
MLASPVSLGISIWLGVMGLLGLWKVQHRLDRRGYTLQAAAVLAGFLFIFAGYYLPRTPVAGTIFVTGLLLAGIFLLFPEVVYWLLLLYDRRWSSRRLR